MKKKRFRLFLSFLGYIILFIIAVFVFSLKWFETSWGDITIETVIFQLNSPLKGTPSNLILSYVTSSILPGIFIILFLLFLLFLSKKNNKKVIFSIRLNKRNKRFIVNSRRLIQFKVILTVIGLIYSSIYVYSQYNRLKIGQYIASLSNASSLFEDYYITPSDKNITFPDQKRNLILIYIESMESTYTSRENGGGKEIDYIKELQEIAASNTSFSNTEKLGGPWQCYGTGWTIAALLSSSSGVPYKLPIGGNDAEKYELFLPGLITLGDVLKNNNYSNYFLCGTDIDFAGRKQFYEQHGDYNIYDLFSAINDGYVSDKENEWGLNDCTLYEIAKDKLTEISKNDEPFNYTMLTFNTHHEKGFLCDLCGNEYPEKYANVIACTSKRTYDFISWCQDQSWYDNTTIIMVGDHLSMATSFWDDINGYDRRTYNCFINSLSTCDHQNTINRSFTTLDYFPTIISSIGGKIENDRLGLGTNLFSDRKTLPEEFGDENFGYQLSLYSKYYDDHFIRANKN